MTAPRPIPDGYRKWNGPILLPRRKPSLWTRVRRAWWAARLDVEEYR